MSDLFMRRFAEITPGGLYRLWLERQWDTTKPPLAVCMLNPSTADGQSEDPTLLALIHFATLWGYGGLIIVNLYGWRSPSPAAMMREAERSTELNRLRGREAMIAAMAFGAAGRMLVAWGNDGNFEGEADRFAEFAADQVGLELVCLGTTQSGAPKHPMARGKHRIPRDQQPIVWRAPK